MLYRLFLAGSLLYAGLLVTVTHLPPANLPATRVSDKLTHFAAYFVLGMLVSTTVGLKRGRVAVPAVLLGLGLFAAADECTQPWVGRIADVADWAADAGGVACSVLLVWSVFRWAIRNKKSPSESHATSS